MQLLRNVFSCLVLICCSVFAAAQTGTIQGTVTDGSGAVISDAKITATSKQTGASRTAVSSDSGAFSIPTLAVGLYSVTVEKTGFAPVKFNEVSVTVAQIVPLNAKLDVGSVQETVTVSGQIAAPVETESSQVSNLVDSTEVKALPLITRNPYELVLLSPGSSQSNSGLGGFNINGARDRNNNFLLDGVDNNDTSVPGIAGGAIASNPENTEEFRIITNNFNAEYGRNTGAIVDVVTKSGTNSLHLDAYWFGRYKNIGGSRDWFNPGEGPNASPQNPYVRNQFGYSIGGPIRKNKTFFFFNQEFQRFPTAQTASVVVPTPQFLSGKFTWHGVGFSDPNSTTPIPVSVPVDLTPGSPQNQFFAGVFGSSASPGLDPTMQKVFSLYPAATSLNPDGVSGLFFFPDASNQRSYQATAKLDHRFTDNEVLSVRYGYDPTKDPSPFFDATLPNNVGSTAISAIGQGLSVDLTSTLHSTMINSFRFGRNHIIADFSCTGLNTLNSPFPLDQFGHGSEFVMGPFGSLACARDTLLSDGQGRTTGTVSFDDNLSWVKGAHTWKFGAEFRDIHEQGDSNFFQRRQIATNVGTQFGGFDVIGAANTVTPDNPSATLDPSTVNFTSLSDAAGAWFGAVIGDNESQFFNKDGSRRTNDNKFFIQHEYGFYGQDSWKIRTNLTLNLGLRYQFNGVPYEKNGNLSNLYTDPTSFPVVFQLAGPGTGRLLFNNDFSQFEPRVGFSWDPWRDGKTAVRGSFGIFHDRVFGNLFGNSRGNPPFQASYAAQPFETINNALFGAGFFPVQPPNQPFDPSIPDGALQAPQIFPRNFRNPALNSWFFGVQRELPGQLVADIAYVGNNSHHIYRDIDPNPPQPALVAQLLAFCSDPNNSFGCTPATVSGAGNLYSGAEFGSLPFNAVAHNAIGRGSLSAVLVDSGGNANYNSLQLKLTKRLQHGLQIQGSYTWSHAIDDSNDPIVPGGGGVSFVRNPLDPGQDRGNSDHDIRHVGVIKYIYELPFGRGKSFASQGVIGHILEGFQLSGIVTAQSGRAFDIIGTRDSQRVGRVGRTDLIGNAFDLSGVSFPVGTKAYFNPNAFTNPAFDRPGFVGRNQFHGPSFFNSDLSLSKKTHLSERLSLETRLEVYNLLNHANFRTPGEIDAQGNALGTPLFGAITQQIGRPDGTTGARQMQMAAKLIW